MAKSPAGTEVGSIEWAREFADRFAAAWSSGPGQSERLVELMTEDVDYAESLTPQPLSGHAEVRDFAESVIWCAFPDFTVERVGEPMVAPDGSAAAFWWRGRMTHTGLLNPAGIPATGKTAVFEGCDFDEFRDGKLSRKRIFYDVADIARQLGVGASE